MYTLRQIIRGCGILPHVGEHPGTGWLIVFIMMGAFAGRGGGIWGVLGGALFMAVFMGSIYLYGAYCRAEDSDRWSSTGRYKTFERIEPTL